MAHPNTRHDVSPGCRYSLFPRSIVSRYMSSPCAHCSLCLHSTSLFQLLPPSKNKYGPRPTFDPYMATLRGIVNSELPSYRLKILYPTTYQTHRFGTHSNTLGNRSISALDAPTRYTPRIMSYAPFCALVSTHESMGPMLDTNQ